MNSEKEVPVVSRGERFKAQHGYSLTMKRNMKRKGLNVDEFSDSLAAYRDIRKKRKAKERAQKKKKHEDSVLHMRHKGKARKRKDGKICGSVKRH